MNERQTHLDWRFGLQWVVGLFVGSVTGLGMMWLLRQETAVAL